MESLKHLSDEQLKLTLGKAIALRLNQDFCNVLKKEVKMRAEKKKGKKTADVTDIFKG